MVSCRVTGAVSTNGAPRAPRIHFDKKRRAGLSIKSKLKNPDNPSRRATRLAASSISGRSVSRTTVADPVAPRDWTTSTEMPGNTLPFQQKTAQFAGRSIHRQAAGETSNWLSANRRKTVARACRLFQGALALLFCR
jgi:hypothetical protein